MKTEELIAMGLAGLAVFLIYKATSAGSATGAAPAYTGTWKKVTEILDPNSGRGYSNGWRYFDDGTSISPSGDYYLNGNIIWSPAK